MRMILRVREPPVAAKGGVAVVVPFGEALPGSGGTGQGLRWGPSRKAPQVPDIRSRRVQAVVGRHPKCEAAVPPSGF